MDTAELNQATRTINPATGQFGPVAPVNQIDHAQTSNVGVIYKFDNGIAPYVSYATSFYPQPGAESGGKPFAPLTGEQEEAGIRYLPPGYNVMMAAAVFDITQNNVLQGDPANPGFQKPLGSIRSRGAEFEVKTTNLYGFNIIGSYTHLEPTMIASPVASAIGKVPAGIAANQAALWTTYRFAYGALDGLTLGGGVRYVGESWGDPLNTLVVPSFTLLDLTARYELGAISPAMKNWSVALNVKNVFDKTYVSSCEDAQDCYYGPGRAIDVTLRGRW
jgi:iron complex outermembrane receptor protein